jgi:hypothetical protein
MPARLLMAVHAHTFCTSSYGLCRYAMHLYFHCTSLCAVRDLCNRIHDALTCEQRFDIRFTNALGHHSVPAVAG